VDSRADAEALVRAVRYPPAGRRGFATYPRAGRFGEVPPAEHHRHADESTLVLVMLESPTAVAEAGSILRCPGIDGYLVGTADLQAASGPDDPAVAQALQVVGQQGREAGSLRADLAGGVDAASRSLDDGAHLVVYNLTQVLMEVFRGLRVQG
jgi:4-hydroxy-2-oxoheptanedioate aldolase